MTAADARSDLMVVYSGEGSVAHLTREDGKSKTLCGRGWQVRPLGHYVEDGAECQTCIRVWRVADPVPQPPGDEVVRARCGCGWESEPVPINADVPNGEWFACRDAATEYRSHFDDKHRPLPQFVTEYVAAAPGVSQ